MLRSGSVLRSRQVTGWAAELASLPQMGLATWPESGQAHAVYSEHGCVRRAGILRTMLRFGPALARMGLLAGRLTAPFSKVVDRCVTDPWLRRFLDLECFVLRRARAAACACCRFERVYLSWMVESACVCRRSCRVLSLECGTR